MNKRPTSITIIAWLFIVLDVCALLTTTFSLHNPSVIKMMQLSPIPLLWQYIMIYTNMVAMIVVAIALLKRQNWARWLYVCLNILMLIIGIITSPAKLTLIPSFIIFAIITFFLFRSNANRYFNERRPNNAAKNI